MKFQVSKISKIGVNELSQDGGFVTSTNIAAILASMVTFPYLFVYEYFGYPEMIFVNLLFFVAYPITLLINNAKKHLFAKIWFINVGYLHILSISVYFGSKTGFEFYYFLMPLLSIFIFTKKERFYLLIGCVQFLAFYIATQFLYTRIEPVAIDDQFAIGLYYLSIAALFIFIVGFSYSFRNTSFILQDALDEKKNEMEALAFKLAKYLSPELFQTIFDEKKDVKIETHRKHLTILFSDIVSFTSKSENMELNHLTDWLNNYLDEMAEITIKHKGTLDKFIGDGIMVFFGDPRSDGIENDAFKCVNMAIEMIEKADSIGMEIRIGINTGYAVVGNFGSLNRMDYTAVGKHVNIAARLEAKSELGKILISESTNALIEGRLKTVFNTALELKGIEDPVRTYWVP